MACLVLSPCHPPRGHNILTFLSRSPSLYTSRPDPRRYTPLQFYAVWFSIATMGGMHLFIISTLIIDVFAWNFTDMTWYVILYGIVSNGAPRGM